MLDAGIYEQLSRLVIAMKQKSSQNMAGNRRSVQKGTSAEFSDFREYMPGDDLRRLDWNVYARSERMYIREYFEEKEAVVSVILDTSASMHYGKKSKAELAQDLCAVIAFLTLHHMDRLVLYDSSQMGTPLVVSGGKNALPKVLGWLQARTFSGTETDSFSAVRHLKMHWHHTAGCFPRDIMENRLSLPEIRQAVDWRWHSVCICGIIICRYREES